jgi:hypothetical protein
LDGTQKINHEIFTVIGNWDWQPQKLKEQFGQLLYKDLKYETGKEYDLLTRIGMRLNKKHSEVMYILKAL